jgi:tricorn protease
LCRIGGFGGAWEDTEMLRSAASVFLLLVASVCLADENPPLLLHHPTVSATQIVFAYAGDLWSVPRAGGVAQRLTAGTGTASLPIFSPDGSEIAFTGDYDGNADVYVIPASGGPPRRLTYHPDADEVVGWTRDGRAVLFASGRNSYSRFSRLFTISREGGFPTELPLPIGAEASYSPDGKELAYVPLDHAFEIWKRYRGGRTSPVWIARLAAGPAGEFERLQSDVGGSADVFSFGSKWADVALQL